MKRQEKNKKMEPLNFKNLNIFPINKIQKPENNTKEKKLFKYNNILFFLF